MPFSPNPTTETNTTFTPPAAATFLPPVQLGACASGTASIDFLTRGHDGAADPDTWPVIVVILDGAVLDVAVTITRRGAGWFTAAFPTSSGGGTCFVPIAWTIGGAPYIQEFRLTVDCCECLTEQDVADAGTLAPVGSPAPGSILSTVDGINSAVAETLSRIGTINSTLSHIETLINESGKPRSRLSRRYAAEIKTIRTLLEKILHDVNNQDDPLSNAQYKRLAMLVFNLYERGNQIALAHSRSGCCPKYHLPQE